MISPPDGLRDKLESRRHPFLKQLSPTSLVLHNTRSGLQGPTYVLNGIINLHILIFPVRFDKIAVNIIFGE